MSWDSFASGAASATGAAYAAIQSEKSVKRILEQQKKAHQIEVSDLKAAGLNPILSVNGGGADIGASAPDTSGYAQAGSALANSLQLENDTQRVKNETDTTAAAVERTQAETKNIMQDTVNKMAEEGLIERKKQRELTESILTSGKSEMVYNELKKQQATLNLEIESLKAQYKAAKAGAEKNRLKSEIDRKTAKVDKIVEYGEKLLGAGKSIAETAGGAMTSASKVGLLAL